MSMEIFLGTIWKLGQRYKTVCVALEGCSWQPCLSILKDKNCLNMFRLMYYVGRLTVSQNKCLLPCVTSSRGLASGSHCVILNEILLSLRIIQYNSQSQCYTKNKERHNKNLCHLKITPAIQNTQSGNIYHNYYN